MEWVWIAAVAVALLVGVAVFAVVWSSTPPLPTPAENLQASVYIVNDTVDMAVGVVYGVVPSQEPGALRIAPVATGAAARITVNATNATIEWAPVVKQWYYLGEDAVYEIAGGYARGPGWVLAPDELAATPYPLADIYDPLVYDSGWIVFGAVDAWAVSGTAFLDAGATVGGAVKIADKTASRIIVEARVRAIIGDTYVNVGVICCSSDGVYYGARLRVAADYIDVVMINGTVVTALASTPYPVDESWYNVTIHYGNGEIIVYVNGTAVITANAIENATVAGGVFAIGSHAEMDYIAAYAANATPAAPGAAYIVPGVTVAPGNATQLVGFPNGTEYNETATGVVITVPLAAIGAVALDLPGSPVVRVDGTPLVEGGYLQAGRHSIVAIYDVTPVDLVIKIEGGVARVTARVPEGVKGWMWVQSGNQTNVYVGAEAIVPAGAEANVTYVGLGEVAYVGNILVAAGQPTTAPPPTTTATPDPRPGMLLMLFALVIVIIIAFVIAVSQQ